MCDILILPPKVNVPYDKLENVVWNNPDGYGLLVHKQGNLVPHKELPQGGTDPKVIDKLLRDNEKYTRYLHLRWKTEGQISFDNCHPFLVYSDKDRDVYFMHNGTLYEYKAKSQTDQRSDSRIFAEEILTPLLKSTKGDYSSEIIKTTISKFWGLTGNNRGLIVSNKSDPLIIGLS